MTRLIAVLITAAICWACNVVSAQDSELASTYEHLSELEHFVGDWEIKGPMTTGDEMQNLSLVASYRWMKDKAFMLVTLEAVATKEITYTAIIGWDPDKKRIMSWEFNAKGTIFSYEQQKSEDGWVVKGTGRRADGGALEYRGEFIYDGDEAMHYKGAGTLTKDGEKVPLTLDFVATKIDN